MPVSSLFRKVSYLQEEYKVKLTLFRKRINNICHEDCRDEWQKSAISLKVRKYLVYTMSRCRNKRQLLIKYTTEEGLQFFQDSKLFPKQSLLHKCNFEMTSYISISKNKSNINSNIFLLSKHMCRLCICRYICVCMYMYTHMHICIYVN